MTSLGTITSSFLHPVERTSGLNGTGGSLRVIPYLLAGSSLPSFITPQVYLFPITFIPFASLAPCTLMIAIPCRFVYRAIRVSRNPLSVLLWSNWATVLDSRNPYFSHPKWYFTLGFSATLICRPFAFSEVRKKSSLLLSKRSEFQPSFPDWLAEAFGEVYIHVHGSAGRQVIY